MIATMPAIVVSCTGPVADAIRAFRSAIHGFVALEAAGGVDLPASTDRSFDRLLHTVAVALSSWSAIAAQVR